MSHKSLSILVLMLIALLLPHLVIAQVDVSTATIKGTVLDPAGAVIPNATVTVTSLDRGVSQRVQSGGEGTYQVPLLQPGAYRIEVQSEGFDKTVVQRVELTVGQAAVFDVHLQVGSVKNEMDVNAEAPLIETEKTQQANTLAEKQIDNLPNISRGFTESVFTLPGVSSSDAPRSQFPGYTGFLTSGFSVGGGNGRNNLITLDGGENDYGSGQLRTPNISVESIQEFQVNRSAFGAEFGFTAGTAVNVVTKSGTNDFHGSVYGFFSDQATIARNYFETLVKEPYAQNFFPGVTLGGALVKNKLFFFTSYEFKKIDTPQFRNYLNTPEAMGINGNPDQLNYVKQLASSGNATLAGLAGFFSQALLPMNNPNVASLLTANNGVFNDSTISHDWVTRLDYQPSEKDTFTGRFSFEHWNYTTIGSLPLYANSDASTIYDRDVTLLGTWNRIISPQLVNQLRVQVVPYNSANNKPFTPGTTELSIGDLGVFNNSYTNPYIASQQRYQFEDSLTWLKGNHTFKFGASYRPVHYKVQNNLWFAGEFDFYEGAIPLIALAPAAAQATLAGFNLANGYPLTGPPATNLTALESFSLGLPVAYRQGFNNPIWSDWAHYLGAFVQDSWKVSQRLTLNYGVRLDFDAEPSPVPHNVYFSPRLGIAWQPFGDSKTVVRAGSGIFVAPVNFQIPYLTNLLNDSGKYINQVALSAAAGPAVFDLYGLGLQEGKLPFGQLTTQDLSVLGITPGPGGTGRVIFDIANNYKNPYTIQASLSIARQLSSSTSLEIGYQYYRGVHLALDQETNYYENGQFDPVYGPQYSPINPNIAQTNTYASIGNSTYNGGTISFTKRYSAHLQGQVNYTFSKAIDDVTDFNSQFASFFPTRLYLERGLSAYNIKNNFVANALYSTPFKAGADQSFVSHLFADMTLSPIVYMRSGIPFDIRVPAASNGIPGQSLYARPYYVPRNSGIGPDYYDFDLRLTKSFYFNREKGLKADLIIEGKNVLNHTNFSSVNDQFPLGDPLLLTGPFNVSGNRNIPATQPLGFNSAFPGRQIQFGLKFGW